MMTVLLVSSPLALAAWGCGPSPEEQQRVQLREDFRDSFAHHDPTAEGSQTVSHPKRVMVAQGRSPVVFDVRVAATAHVMDLSAGTELIAVAVARDQWISANEDNGVLVGSRRVLPGPLPTGHEFAILLDVSGDESFQSQAGTDAVPPTPPTRYETTTRPAVLPPGSIGSH